ncbi:MAG: MFS transporter, partial [Gammaproteobacteria bacterium]|nr:MFS transporter [Gammaproteobacteria bacterium]
MMNIKKSTYRIDTRDLLTFIAISLFYLFETAQMSYYNVLAPAYLGHGIYNHASIGAISAAYYYGDVLGLFPVGYALDRFPLRASLIFALVGSILGAFLLFMSDSFSMQWISRFICGFCGGTFSFIGGIRVVAAVFKKRFTYGFSIFLSAGILGAMLCQYPLLIVVNHFGPKGAMFVIFSIGAMIAVFNYFYLHPPLQASDGYKIQKYAGTAWEACKDIVFNFYNWCDVLMIVLLETPGTILGTLWGVVLIMGFFHFTPEVSSLIVAIMLLGSMIGLPVLGHVADRYGSKPWIIAVGAGACFVMVLLMFFFQSSQNLWLIGLLFFGLGFFCSCQTVGFHWVTTNMKPELIGRNSAFNSVIFMSMNGGFKQFCAYLLGIPAIWMT